MTYKTATIKRKLEQVLMSPFVLTGRLYGRLYPLKVKTSFFLFYSGADIGGATKVNADIAECIKGEKPLIIFSKKSKNNGYKALFEGFAIFDLREKIDNKLYHFVNFFYRGVLAEWINSAEKPVVLGGENLFFYKVIPHLKKSVTRIEVCHLDTWFPYSIGFIKLITHRVFSTIKLQHAAETLYNKNNIDKALYARLHFIENKIDIPLYTPVRNDTLQVVFIGRGAPQKRVYLIAGIAAKAKEANLPVHFSFVGDVENVFDIKQYPYCTFYGNIRDEKLMQKIYLQSDLLILTSAYEGLPLVIMYMMAYGKAVLSTAVNSIPDYIKHMENGLLITETDEDKIIEQGISFLELLVNNPQLKTTLGLKGRQMAIEKFGGEIFCRAYGALLVNNG